MFLSPGVGEAKVDEFYAVFFDGIEYIGC